MSDDEEGRVRILLNGKELPKVERVPRRDVYDAYFESYAGFIDEKTVGWETVIELADKAVGQHRLRAESLGKTGKILSEKEIVFEII